MNFRTIVKVAVVALLVMLLPRPGFAVTAEDFGFGNITVNGSPVAGRIPLLVAVFQLSTGGGPRQPLIANATGVFDALAFNVFNVPSLNGYFLENSYGQFSWERAGVIGPANFDANETATLDAISSIDNPTENVRRFGLDSGAGVAYALERIAAKTGYNFAQWDANGNGTIEQHELSIVIVGNNGQRGAANRRIGAAGAGLAIPGQNVTLRGSVASVDHRASFMSLAHELSHSLGTKDLYDAPNCRSSGLTLMSCTIYAVDDDRRTFHLDPWHKMRLGWSRPRVFTLGSGGVATVAAAQINSANTPVILYDPAKGMGEYFLVEFRNNQVAGADHDINITDPAQSSPFTGLARGMAVWHIAPGDPPVHHEGAPSLALGSSMLWNAATPLLKWKDGSSTATSLNPMTITSDGRELTFEWITASDTWVDFAFIGSENGGFSNPFNTMVEGVGAASHGGTLKIKAGTSGESVMVAKRLVLQAVGGDVTIGQ